MTQNALIAIVDDDFSFRSALETFVRSLGHRVIGFDSAEAFLDSGQARAAGVIVSDIQMPGMSGLELRQHLNSEGIGTEMVLVTARTEEKYRTQARDGGVAHFLQKPFDPQELADCIARALAA